MIPMTAVTTMRGVGIVPALRSMGVVAAMARLVSAMAAVVDVLTGGAAVVVGVGGGVGGVGGVGRSEVLVVVTRRLVVVLVLAMVVLVGSGRACSAGRAGSVGHRFTSMGSVVRAVAVGVGVARLVG